MFINSSIFLKFCSSKAKFRQFQKNTFDAYGNSDARIFLFVLRVKFALKQAQGPPKRLPLSALLLNSAQITLFESLYQLLVNRDSPAADNKASIGDLVHKIHVSFLQMELDMQKKLGSVVEQTLAISMTTAGGEFRSSNFLTGQCAHLHRAWLSTLAHSAILGSFEQPYELPSELPPGEESTIPDKNGEDYGGDGDGDGGGEGDGSMEDDLDGMDETADMEDEIAELNATAAAAYINTDIDSFDMCSGLDEAVEEAGSGEGTVSKDDGSGKEDSEAEEQEGQSNSSDESEEEPEQEEQEDGTNNLAEARQQDELTSNTGGDTIIRFAICFSSFY